MIIRKTQFSREFGVFFVLKTKNIEKLPEYILWGLWLVACNDMLFESVRKNYPQIKIKNLTQI